MTVANKIAINTSALYIKIIVNILVVIFTTRIALEILGTVDFGLFNLIAGIIVLLSFLNSALLSSTQRFLSIAIGAKNNDNLLQVFNTSLLLHSFLAILIFIIFTVAQPYLFDYILNISPQKTEIAVITYNIVSATMIITIITVPYNAVINAREDMCFYAITDIAMSLFKLIAALLLMYVSSSNLLGWYAFFILIGSLICFLIKLIWCKKKYFETKIEKKYLFNRKQLKEQLGFTGWNTLVSFSMVCRNQGVAIILNIFYGTGINASYGIANQLNGLTTTFSSALSNVFAPQIIQSKGANNEQRMNNLASLSSKLSFIISAIIAFPIIFEAKTILSIWLTSVPTHTVSFCNISVYTFVVMQLYPGVVRSLYAYGKIKWYQISVSILLFLPIIIGYFSNKYFGTSPDFILYLVLIAQIFTLFSTMIFAHNLINQKFSKYFSENVLKPCTIFIITYLTTKICCFWIDSNIIRLCATCIFSTLTFSILSYIILLTNNEKIKLKEFISNIITKRAK